jgi:hypothetical protein
MKRRVIRRPRAIEDFIEQTTYYLENAGDETADRFLSAAEETPEQLLDLPFPVPAEVILTFYLKNHACFQYVTLSDTYSSTGQHLEGSSLSVCCTMLAI